MPKQVVVYSQPGWLFCGKVKEFLSQKGIAYVDRDVTKDDQAFEELTKLGFLTTPVIKVDDDVVVGFDHVKLDRLLGS